MFNLIHKGSQGFTFCLQPLALSLFFFILLLGFTMLIMLTGLASAVGAFDIPSDRTVTWQGNIGVEGGIPARTTEINCVTNYNVPTDGVTNARPAIQGCINGILNGQAAFLPAGTYYITGSLSIPSNKTLRGAGSGVTIIQTDVSISGTGIIRFGSGYTDATSATISSISTGYTKGSTQITLADATAFTVGDFIYIDELNDPSIPVIAAGGAYYGVFPGGTTRTFVITHKVTGKAGNTLTITPPAVYTFQASLSPRAIKATPTYTQYAGVENLTIKNILVGNPDANGRYPNNNGNVGVMFQGAANSWAKNIKIENCGKRCVHIYFDAFRNEVRDSWFEGCLNRYDSDRCYAVDVHLGSFNLIENNVYAHTGEGNMTSSAVGNVFAYNYSYDVGRTADTAWFWSSDWTHGTHSAFNLYEGNDSAGVKWDYIHGSGSHNTSFRNRYHGKCDIMPCTNAVGAIITERNNHYMNEAGNVLGTSFWSNKYEHQNANATSGTNPIHVVGVGDDYTDSFNTKLRHMNFDYYTNSIKYCSDSGEPGCQGGSSDTSLPASLYLTSKPSFFGNLPWPAIGPDLNPMVGTIPAKELFDCKMAGGCGGSNVSPTVTLSANITSGNAPLSVNFTATASDSDGTITQYEWDLDGNGTYEATNTNSTRTYIYNSAGTYNARVRVTDNSASTATSVVTITVSTASGGGNGGDTGGNAGGDASGGSGCGFVKEDNSNKVSKGQSGRVADIGLMILLFLSLIFIGLRRKISRLPFWVFLFAISIISASNLHAEIIPSDRRIEWSPGIPGGIPNRTTICANVKNSPYNAVGDGAADDTTAIQNAINACAAGQVVYVPEGTYKTTNQLIISKGIVLRGDGPDKTKIKLNTSNTSNVIRLYQPSSFGPNIGIVSGYEKNSATITVQDAASLAVSDYIILSELNKPGLVTIDSYSGSCTYCGLDNGTRTMTQIVQIIAKDGNTLTLNRPLYFAFEASLDPMVRETAMMENAGIEDLYVEQIDPSGAYAGSNNISIYSCSRCWVKNVESYKPVGAHIKIQNSYANEIRENYLHEGHNYSSGRTYGVFLMNTNSDHLIEDNIIYKTRHSMVLEGGGSGNVFGYNYAKDVYSEPDTTWLSGDMNTHGAHPYMNLFEGNIFAKLEHDITHGSSSHNTSFRNFITRSSTGMTIGLIAVDIQSNNYYENLVGNILVGVSSCSGTLNYGESGSRVSIYKIGYDSPGDNAGPDDIQVENTLYRHGNFDCITSSTTWDISNSDRILPNSLYLSSKPAFFGNIPWPPIGPDLNPMVGTIPAKELFDCKMAGGCGGTGGDTPPPPSGGDGDSSASGGSGCGFVKDSKNNGAQNLTLLAAALIIILFLRKTAKKISLSKYQKIFLFCLIITSLSATPLSAATINATSCSASDVQVAIDAAGEGDTVSVPAGSCTWDGKIPLNKKISIIGAGIDNTIIDGHGFNAVNGTNNWRISGFTFSSSSVSLAIQVGASRSSIGCRNFRIDNNKFIGYGAWIQVDGHSTGVIDHNQFLRNFGSGIYVFGDDESAWARDTGLGTDDFVFIEDNTFDTNGVNNGHFILAGYGGRMVVRYNTMKESGGGYSPGWIDTHGYCHGSFDRGTRAFEIYENKLIRNIAPPNYGCCYGLFLRGGTGVVFNNTFDQTNGEFIQFSANASIFLVEYRASQWAGTKSTCSATCSTSQWCSTGLGGEGAPCCDQIGRGKDQQDEPLYLWGNVDQNNSPIGVVVHAGSQDYIRSNIDYFTAQKANYTPYTYPHPLTTSSDTGGGDTGGNTSSSGGDTSSGGSGCGFVKDDGKGQKAKGEGPAFAIMLIIALAGIALARRIFMLKNSAQYKDS